MDSTFTPDRSTHYDSTLAPRTGASRRAPHLRVAPPNAIDPAAFLRALGIEVLDIEGEEHWFGVSLWMHVRGVIDAKALQEMKHGLLGVVPKKSPQQKRAAKDARVIELRREHADITASAFVRDILTAEFEIRERQAWRLWKRHGVTDPSVTDPLPSLASPEGGSVTDKKRGSNNVRHVARTHPGSNVDKPATNFFVSEDRS